MIHANISSEILDKDHALPRSEIFDPTLPLSEQNFNKGTTKRRNLSLKLGHFFMHVLIVYRLIMAKSDTGLNVSVNTKYKAIKIIFSANPLRLSGKITGNK